VLRWLALATAVAMAVACTAIRNGASPWVVLALIQVHALCSSPTWGLGSTVVFARLADAKKEFGPIRAMATLGWMGGCLLVSAIGADQSPLAGYGGSLIWLLVAAMTFWLPAMEPPAAAAGLTWTQRFGLDALSLLRDRDHRVVFLTTTLFTIPLAGFYPYTPPLLRELGFEHTSAWMSLGQITEVVAMVSLGALLLRWRLKWIFAVGLVLGVVRFGLVASGARLGVLAGVLLHGGSFTLVLITAQIYLDQRVDPAWRARGQALMTLMNGGIGNTLGYLGVGGWFAACGAGAGGGGAMRWPAFWTGLALANAAVLAFFLFAYRGRGTGLLRREAEPAGPAAPA
jgi:Nucleoside H+ symporter